MGTDGFCSAFPEGSHYAGSPEYISDSALSALALILSLLIYNILSESSSAVSNLLQVAAALSREIYPESRYCQKR